MILKKKFEKGELGISYIKSEGFDVPKFHIRKKAGKSFLVFESLSDGKVSLDSKNFKVFGPVEKKLKRKKG